MKTYIFSWLSLFFVVISFIIMFNTLTLSQQSIRLDEAQSLWVSTKPIPSILKITGEDVHVPLYGILLHFWLQIFGATILAARIPSLIFFILTLPVLYKVIRESSSHHVARISIIFFGISPFIVWYSNEARMYTLFTFVASLSHLYFLRLIRSEGMRGVLGYFISLVLGLYTHYFFLFLVLTQFIYLVYRYVVLKEKLWVVVFLMLSAGLLFAPWAYYAYHLGSGSNTQPEIPAPTSYNIFQTLVLFLFGFQSQLLQSILISFWPLIVIILFFIFTRRHILTANFLEYFVLVTLLPVLIVFSVSLIKPIFLARYLIFVVPTLFYLVALLFNTYRWQISRILLGSFVVTTVGLLFYQNISAKTVVKEDYRDVVSLVSEQATPQDIVAVTAPFTVYPIEYYYHGQARIDTIPEWDRFNQGGIPPFSVQKLSQQINTYQKQYSKLYVILSYDQGYEEQIKQYLDQHLQRLKLQNFSAGLQLRVYKLRYDLQVTN